ncbi:MAG: hypothetical protein GMKNLPBB_01058 [Myxococcota bacterium]|nr:hypothetical protein [Myxococcota bacterium]
MKLNTGMLIGLAAAQLALAYGVWEMSKPPAALAARPLISVLQGGGAANVAELEISGGGEMLKLVNQQNTWVAASASNYPARDDKVKEALEKLQKLQVREPVAASVGSQASLKVSAKDAERVLKLTVSGQAPVTLYLGKSGSGGKNFVRLEGSDDVYEVKGVASWNYPTTVSSWVDTTLVKLDFDTVKEVRIENEKNPLHLLKDASGWTLAGVSAGETVKKSEVESLARKAADISFADVLGGADVKPQTPFPRPITAVVTGKPPKKEEKKEEAVKLGEDKKEEPKEEPEKTYSLKILGKNDAKNQYVVQVEGIPYTFGVSDWLLKPLVERERKELLEAPKDASATPAGSSAPAP